jgi:hypothetical protein
MGFAVDKVEWAMEFSEYFDIPSKSFYDCSTFNIAHHPGLVQ